MAGLQGELYPALLSSGIKIPNSLEGYWKTVT